MAEETVTTTAAAAAAAAPVPEQTTAAEVTSDSATLATPAPAEKREPEYPSHLLTLAQELGISEDDARSQEPAQLERSLRWLETYQRRLWQQSAEQPPARKEEPPAGKQTTIEEDLAFMDPKALAHIKALKDQVDSLSKASQLQQENFQRQQAYREEQAIDSWFATEGKKYSDSFTDKPLQEIMGSAESRERVKVWALAEELLRGSNGRRSIGEAMTLAASALHYGRADEKARSEVAGQLRDRAGQFTARPTQRTRRIDDMPNGDEKALAVAREFMRERGALEIT